MDGVTGTVPEPLPDWLTGAARITALTGAGISTDSGIPDYRGPQGVWTRDPDAEKMVTLSYYVADPGIRRRAWLARRDMAALQARPNAGHAALADLEAQGRLRTIVTQNVDGLHQAAGSSPERVVEIHGTVHEVECLGCRARTTMSEALERVAAGSPTRPAAAAAGSSSRRRSASGRSSTAGRSTRRSPRPATATSSSPSAPRSRCGR